MISLKTTGTLNFGYTGNFLLFQIALSYKQYIIRQNKSEYYICQD